MPIMHRDDSFATMLLTCALSPDREELVHPLCATDFHELRLLVARAGAPLGQLIGMDMSGVMRLLEVDEMTAYRLCILLGRILPLSYMLESLAERAWIWWRIATRNTPRTSSARCLIARRR